MIKVSSYELQMTAFVYNYVMLEYSVFIFLDLYQIATVCSLPSQLLSVEIIGMYICELTRNTNPQKKCCSISLALILSHPPLEPLCKEHKSLYN